MNNTLNPDMFVSTSENIASHDFRFPAGMQQELEQIPGVAEIQSERSRAAAVSRLYRSWWWRSIWPNVTAA